MSITDSTIHNPIAVPISARDPSASGGTDQTAASAIPSSTVSRTSRKVAELASRWRVARRRIVTPMLTMPVSTAQPISIQRGTRPSNIITTSAAPIRLAPKRKRASWRPACNWAARIGPQSVVSAGSYRPSSARTSIRGVANWEEGSVLTLRG